jgi:hypothetical protein
MLVTLRRALSLLFFTAVASVTAWGALSVTTTSPLPGGAVGVTYSQTLQASGGTPPYLWTAASLPAGLTLSSSGTLSGTPTSAGTQTIAVTVTDSAVSAAPATAGANLSLTISALPTLTLTGLPTTAGQQALVTAALSGAFPSALSGTLTLTFTPAGAHDDPNIQFLQNGASAGSRQVAFTIAAGSTTAVFTGGTTRIATGTTSGTITITPSALTYSGGTIPAPAPSQITIRPTPPVITRVAITSISGGFNIAVTGYSTPRDMSSALFHFTPTTGTNLASLDVTVQLGALFINWYNSSASIPFGSEFTVTVPFTFQVSSGPVSIAPVAAVTVSLTNSVGVSATSNPANP